MITMVNHLSGHTAVDADIFACDESCLVGAEEQHHIGDVHRVANTSCWLLHRICAIVLLIISVYPSWRNGVDPCLVPKCDGKGVGEGSNTSLSSSLALCLRLTHAVARG